MRFLPLLALAPLLWGCDDQKSTPSGSSSPTSTATPEASAEAEAPRDPLEAVIRGHEVSLPEGTARLDDEQLHLTFRSAPRKAEGQEAPYTIAFVLRVPPGPDGSFPTGEVIHVEMNASMDSHTPEELRPFYVAAPLVSLTLEPFERKEGARIRGRLDAHKKHRDDELAVHGHFDLPLEALPSPPEAP